MTDSFSAFAGSLRNQALQRGLATVFNGIERECLTRAWTVLASMNRAPMSFEHGQFPGRERRRTLGLCQTVEPSIS